MGAANPVWPDAPRCTRLLAGTSPHMLVRDAPSQSARQATPRLFRAKAPLRISFAGGGTDVPPYPERHGGAVLSVTIDRCATADLRPRRDGDYHVESRDL